MLCHNQIIMRYDYDLPPSPLHISPLVVPHKLEFFLLSLCCAQVEPVTPQRVGPAPMYMYQNMPHPNQSTLPASLSMAGTLPIRSIPVSR